MNRVTIAIACCLLAASVNADQISIPHPPQSNTQAKAAEMRANFDTIVEEMNLHDQRINSLQDGADQEPVLVDCNQDSNALQAALDSHMGDGPPLSFAIAGICEATELVISRRISLSAYGSFNGFSGTAGIGGSSPTYLGSNNLVIFVEDGGHLSIDNLLLVNPWLFYSNGSTGHLTNNVIYDQLAEYPSNISVSSGGSLYFNGPGTFNDRSEPFDDVLLLVSRGAHLDLHATDGKFSISSYLGASVLCSGCDNAAFNEIKLTINSSICFRDTASLNVAEWSITRNSTAVGPISGIVASDDSSLVEFDYDTYPCIP